MIAPIAAAGAAFLLLLNMIRIFAGPTLHDRALAVNGTLTKAVLVCAALAVATGRTETADAALALALGAFLLGVAVLKFFRTGTFQAPMARAGDD